MIKQSVLTTFGVIVFASASFAALGDVVSSFRPPADNPYAIARDPSHVYVFCLDEPYYVYTLTTAGSVLASWPSPHEVRTRGLGYEYGGYLWLGYFNYLSVTARVSKVDAANGSVVSSFSLGYVHDMYGGVACQGNPGVPGITSVITSDYLPYRAARYTTAGSLISSFDYPSSLSFRDPGWDYGNGLIWWADYENSTNPYVYGYTTAGSLAASFRAPGINMAGCGYYGGYLWFGGGVSGNYWIYRVHCPVNVVSVVPASVGKVKALFR